MYDRSNRQFKRKQKTLYRGGLFLFLFFIMLLTPPHTVVSQSPLDRDPNSEQFAFIKKLYEHKDYYRSISEILKIRFHYPQTSEKSKLDLYLLKSYFQLHEYSRVDTLASEIIRQSDSMSDKTIRKQSVLILMTSLLEQGREEVARSTWETYRKDNSAEIFPSSAGLSGLVDPNRAAFYSGILPGSGLLLSEQYGKAVVSLALNLLFVAGSYYAFTQQQYGISGLLIFFEISWYFGGKKASAEAAHQFIQQRIKHIQQNWMQKQLQNNNLSDLIRDAEK